MGWFKESPAFHNFPVSDSPDDDPAKFQSLTRLRIRGCPMIADHDSIVFRNHVFNIYVEIREALQRCCHVLNCARRPWRHAGRNVSAVIDKIWSEIYISNVDIFFVHEFFEVTANKFFRRSVSHSGFGVDWIHRSSLPFF
jgi:hypothetical protein